MSYNQNNNNKYNEIRKTEYLQPLDNLNNKVNNQIKKTVNQYNYQREPTFNPNERYTVAASFPSDSLFDLKSTNSVMGFIPPDSKNKFIPSVKTKKILCCLEGQCRKGI